jgi:hypothetical protein
MEIGLLPPKLSFKPLWQELEPHPGGPSTGPMELETLFTSKIISNFEKHHY